MAAIKYLDLAGLQVYDAQIKTKISEGDAKAFKNFTYDEATRTLKVFKAETVTADTVADFTMTLPEDVDVSNFIEKIESATEGNVVVANADGTVKDGGVALNTLATKAEVEAIDGKADANADAIALLNNNAETEGSVDYKIAQAVAAIIENPDDTMNSINELVTWINGHAEDALELSNKVTANEGAIADLETLVGTEGVAKQIEDAIAEALTVEGADKYALAADLTSAIARVATLEGKAHTHTFNEEVLNGITAEKVTAWDSAEQNAKDYADGLDEAMDTRMKAVEEAMGEGGSVGTQITDKIAELDADITSAEVEEGKGVRVQVVEVDGKVTTVAVTGNFDNSYEAKGASATALDSAKSYADGLAVNYDAAGSAQSAETNAKNYAGAIPETSEATSVVGYIQELVGTEPIEAIPEASITALFNA